LSEEKTEEASPRQEQRARERGRAWQSRDLAFGSVLVLCGGLVHAYASSARDALLSLFSGALAHLDAPPRLALERNLLAGVALSLPLLVGIVAIGALVSAVQVGGLFAPAAVAPDASRLDPSGRSPSGARIGSNLLLGLARLVLLTSVAFVTLVEGMPGIATLARQVPAAALRAATTMTSALMLRTGLALLAFGVLDAIVERALFRASIRMTRREREREQRDAEGDAHVRRERERTREELHRGGDLEETRAAALVVASEDVAIALAYDETDPDAVPRVTAIARADRVGEVTREAIERGVSLARDEALAEQLAILPLGAVIPEALYEAVARAMKRGARA
jgi:flagellar biosynthesis protein FlhB